MPDVLVYLCEGGTRTGFLRFKSSALITRGFDLAPSWHKLHPVKPIGSVGPKTPTLPSLLLSVSLGLREAATAWPPMPPLLPTRTVMRPYELRLHLCMGKDLPAKDDVTLAAFEFTERFFVMAPRFLSVSAAFRKNSKYILLAFVIGGELIRF